MNMNIFAWIREGVRQSVLAGVADAVEQLGPTVDGDDLRPRIAAQLRRQTPGLDNTPGENSTGTAGRSRRLGRTLKDVDVPHDQ